MNKTSIEWVKNPDGTQGYTWNPITGCLNHTPEGLCLGGLFPCYAYRLANGRLKQRYLANLYCVLDGSDSPFNDPFYPRFWKERLSAPYSTMRSTKRGFVYYGQKPKGIFVCDMGELFGDWIPKHWQAEIFQTISDNPQHRFYLLTKQPQNLAKWSPFEENCWVGVTATDADMAFDAINHLDDVQANVRYLSFEPLLGSINLVQLDVHLKETIDWLIIGATTGTLNDLKPLAMQYPSLALMPFGKRWTLQPKIEWVQEIVKAADRAGIPVFLKDNLSPLFPWKLPEWARDKWGLHLKQEMPKGGA